MLELDSLSSKPGSHFLASELGQGSSLLPFSTYEIEKVQSIGCGEHKMNYLQRA
jgi:hypothetical protein